MALEQGTIRNTRIILVDDHQVVLDGLELILGRVGWINLVGRASTGEEAVELAKSASPDLAVMDLRLPGMSGIEVMIKIRESDPLMKFVVLTAVGEREDVFEAIDAGAHAYLLKNSTKSELVSAIATAVNGGSVLSPGLLSHLANQGTRERRRSINGNDLTGREFEVLNYMSKGFANKQIAQQLEVSVSTVKAHVANILVKFEASDRTEAVVGAIRAQIIKI